MPILPNAKHEQFAQLCAAGLSRSAAYRKAAGSRAGKNADANSDDWLNARGVRERIRELQERNSRKSEMTRKELLSFYAEAIRTPADQVPAGSPVIQAYEETPEGGRKVRICDKVQAGAQLARMCDWNSAERVEVSANSLTSYLLQLRSQSLFGGTFSPAGTGTHVIELESGAIGSGENGSERLDQAANQ